MSRDPERCPTTGALVDACRHCADDLSIDTPEHDEPEETAVPAPPPTVTDRPEMVDVVVTATWTAHVSAPAVLVEQLAARHDTTRAELLSVVAAERMLSSATWRGLPLPKVVDPRLAVTAVALIDVDVEAIP